ncbi:MAG: GGDEF domain-containing protein [Lachnospiraceae bacterium]|nr:GGDEF domain-containing protein [Lachnospiraceae bacterium]
MNPVLIALNSMSILYLAVMLVGCYQIPGEALGKTRHFRYCLSACLAGIIAETIAMVVDGDETKAALIIACNFLATFMIDPVVYYYVRYLQVLLTERGGKTQGFLSFLAILSRLDLLIVTAECALGYMLKIRNGFFEEGSLFQYRMVIPTFIFACIFVFFIFNYRSFGINSIWLTMLFLVIPTASTLISNEVAQIRYGYCLTALSLFVVYIVIQSKIIVETDVNARLFNRLSNCDSLTGLKNRRGYQDVIDSLGDEETVGVVFCDANGLKRVNDNYGHEAGDAMIKRIAGILRNAFPDAEVCRISGDEFVCVIKKTDEEEFHKRMRQFGDALADAGRIAAFGYEIGIGRHFCDLVKAAEKKMYLDKELYYTETGGSRRS